MKIVLNLGLPTAMLGSFLFVAAAGAADVETAPPEPAPPPQSEWTFTVAPYVWAAGISGNVGLCGLQPVNIEQSFSDIIGDLQFGAMFVTELQNGTWGLFADIIYAKTSSSTDIVRSIGGVPATLTATVDTSS